MSKSVVSLHLITINLTVSVTLRSLGSGFSLTARQLSDGSYSWLANYLNFGIKFTSIKKLELYL